MVSGIMGQGRACLACYIDTRWFSTSAVGRPLLRNLSPEFNRLLCTLYTCPLLSLLLPLLGVCRWVLIVPRLPPWPVSIAVPCTRPISYYARRIPPRHSACSTLPCNFLPHTTAIMNVTKKFDRLKQWTNEKMGAEARTGLSDEFKALEVEMNLRHEGMHESEPCSSSPAF